jgi:hypothetical protein
MRKCVTGWVVAVSVLAGCQAPNAHREQFGKVYYIDGAGDWGFGASAVPRGLREAGFKGDVERFGWTRSFVPLVDHMNERAARSAANQLASRIEDYRRRHPHTPVHIIALSAGTGVAVWACEALDSRLAIDNVFLLGSSLSYNYDMSQALRRVRRHVYVYHSPRDAVLTTVQLVGTVDRKLGIKSAGQVGLHTPTDRYRKIINTPWSERWIQLGWNGGHTDCIGASFVRSEIALKIVPRVVLTGYR